MKTFSAVLFVLGLMDACLGRSMEPAAIKKRFREAKYAFKFRVVSKSTEECFPGSFAVTTPETSTTSTTIPTTVITSATADTTHRTTTNSSPRSTVVTLAETTKGTTRKTTPSVYGTTNTVEETLTDRLTTAQVQTTRRESITNAPVATTEGNSVQNSFATHENPTGRGPVSTQSQTEQQTTLPLDNNPVNTSESMGQSRRKRSCEMMVYHQDIIIGRKHIYRACNEVNEMKRVQGMNKKYLKSTIRLQMGFSELKPNRNYFFMGRAVPGQDPADYVFMADELTVVNWKTSAWKLKKYLRSNGGRCN